MTLNLQATSQISGRVVDDHGQGVAAQVVEVWTKGTQWLNPCPVEFAKGPVRTVSDGSFQTPQTLLAGSIFRVVVRAPGKGPDRGRLVHARTEPTRIVSDCPR